MVHHADSREEGIGHSQGRVRLPITRLDGLKLDTNVLVRYLAEDDAKQGALAAGLINKAIADDTGLFV